MKLTCSIVFILFFSFVCGKLIPQTKNIIIDASDVSGDFQMTVGTHGKPYNGKNNFISLYKKLGFKVIRNHDYYGPTDWYTIFPDWRADADKESSYDFRSSDSLIIALANEGFEILFRLGSSWKGKNKLPVNDPPGTVRDKNGKVTHIADQNDFKKFAVICRHIVMHYNDGWADGHHLNIKRWEIWNEPSLTAQFWTGNYKQFREMFAAVAKELKKYNSSLLVGGPAQEDMCRDAGYYDSLLAYCKRENVPLDFYSFHTYGGLKENMTPFDVAGKYKSAREKLDKYGYKDAYIICDEYNCEPRGNFSNTPKAAAFIVSFLVYSEEYGLKETYFYRGDDHPMGLVGMNNGKEKYETLPFLAWKVLTENSRKIKASGTDEEGFAVTASLKKDEGKLFVLISNHTRSEKNIDLVIENLKQGTAKFLRREISDDRKLEQTEKDILVANKEGNYLHKFRCPESTVQFIEIDY